MNLISHDHKAIFFHMPKNGGTTMTSILLNNGWVPLRDSAKEFLNYYIFIYSRNPYDRYISGWKRTIAKAKNESKPMEDFVFDIKDFRKDQIIKPIYNGGNFEEHFGTHFYYTQTHIVNKYVGSIDKIDKIFKLEDFDASLAELKHKFGLKIDYVNKNISQATDTEAWLNSKIRRYIKKYYHDDFINFQYNK